MHQENVLTTQTCRQNVLKYKSSTQKGFISIARDVLRMNN